MPFKYLIALSVPLSCIHSLSYDGLWAYTTPLYVFGLIPFLEQWFPRLKHIGPVNNQQEWLFDLMLWLNVPVVYGVIGYFIHQIKVTPIVDSIQLIGWTLSVGIVLGANGINVAHEFGHRKDKASQWAARLLLLPCLYMHFTKEHNKGHHRYVSTPEDPATARKNEWLQVFWFRSMIGCYLNAWKLQMQELRQKKAAFFSLQNELLGFSLMQTGYVLIFSSLLGFSYQAFVICLSTAFISILLLETINYIEHYGLQRQKIKGRWEKVQSWHSWNSDHELGRVLLYELTLHSDHHFKATKKYPYLDNIQQAPQLPLGYPGSMLLAFFPPLWFAFMNPRVESLQKHTPSL